MSKNVKIFLKRKDDKERENMCKKLVEINGISPEKLLAISGQSDIFPIDVSEICYNLGIRLKSFDFKPIEKELKQEVEQKGNILGAVVVNGDDLAILYRENDPINRRRFTIAHELAHACIHMQSNEQHHIEFRTDENLNNQKELEANIFAGELLIPTRILYRLINNEKLLTKKDLYFLSELFMVSENVMRERLKILKIKILE